MYKNIPEGLRTLNQWVCTNNSKAPINPKDGSYAKLNDPSTWGSFQDAVEAVEDNNTITHIGFVFTENDPYIGVDLDHIDQDIEFAESIADKLRSYTELSKSGNGLHIICKGSIPVKAMKTKFEMKYSNTYFIMTGNLYKEYGSEIEDRSEVITELYETYKKPDTKIYDTVTDKCCTSDEVSNRLVEALSDVSFRSYYIGNRPTDDESSNDMGFMSKIVEWFGRDYDICMGVFVNSPYFLQKDEPHKRKILREDYTTATYEACASTIERTKYEQPSIKIIRNIKDTFNVGDLTDPPSWVRVEYDDDGGVDKVSIDEPEFIEWFKESTQIVNINDNYYSMDGLIPDGYVSHTVHNCVKPFVSKGLDNKVRSLVNSLKREVYMPAPIPPIDKVFTQNAALQVYPDGSLSTIANEFTLNRLNVDYDPEAECPLWHSVLNQLVDSEDQKTLQEFLGYCLIPTTKAQYALFLIGNGGEGKSVINQVMGDIMTTSACYGKLEDIDGNRFFNSELENKLMMIVDDTPTTKLAASSQIKTIITSSQSLRVEAKGVKGYHIRPYARIFGCGNNFVQCKDDVSDGFYRRMLQIPVLPKPKRVDDRMIVDKLLKEKSGIFNWLLEGLSSVVSHGYNIYISPRVEQQLDATKRDAVSVLDYLLTSGRIEFNQNYIISNQDFYDDYENWCNENGITPMMPKTVTRFINQNCAEYEINSGSFREGGKKKRGYQGIKFTNESSHTRKRNFILTKSVL